MATQEGGARFPEAVVALGGREQNVVYRLHPRTGATSTCRRCSKPITQEMLSDMLVVFHGAGVESFVVNEKLFNSLQVAESVKVEAAKESPLGGGLSGSIDAAGDHSQARSVVTKKKASFPDPENPHLLTTVAHVIDEGPNVHEATIQFCMEDKWLDSATCGSSSPTSSGWLPAWRESKWSSEASSWASSTRTSRLRSAGARSPQVTDYTCVPLTATPAQRAVELESPALNRRARRSGIAGLSCSSMTASGPSCS
jgi:hypothetical protein